MRTITSTLLEAQKSVSATPHVKVEVLDAIAGVPRPTFTRLYTGSEADFYHDATCPSDGSLVRARVNPSNSYLYVQRVANPGPSSDFSSWSYLNTVSGASSISLVSRGANVHIFYVNTDGKDMFRRESNDYGATWSSPIHVLNPDVASVAWLAGAISATGTLALFYASSSHVVYVTKLSGVWSNPDSWTNTVASITGMDCVFQGDWNLVITGRESSTNDAKVWACVYGNGVDQATGTWSSLREMNTARSDSNVSFHYPSMAKPDLFRMFCMEKYTGSPSYQRPMHSHALASASFSGNLWREPAPFDLSSSYGTSLAATANDLWLCTPYGVWRGPLSNTALDLTGDVLELSLQENPEGGAATVILRNDDGRYNAVGSGAYVSLRKGSELRISPGYGTSAGQEVSQGPAYWIEGWEYRSSPGKSLFVLFARSAWRLLDTWWARRQYTWNAGTTTVADTLKFVLARRGLDLSTAGASSYATTLKPAFTIHPGEIGAAAARRLLAKDPQASDATSYTYGTGHTVLQGRYGFRAQGYNRVQVFGNAEMGEAFAWGEVEQLFDRLLQVHDLNLDTPQKAQDRANAALREQLLAALAGEIAVPTNCGQELYDVIEVTDAPAGLSSARRRVLGLELRYSRGPKPEYRHTFSLGGV
ncbi:MAG: hypothetical protein HW388_729 [Dehalococcoidia bacterium]|nr:hypothetical protein [Dehalococcoidia bacterium]